MSGQEKHLYEFGPFRLDPLKRRLLRGDEMIPLTPKAFETLLALVQESGKTLEKDELMRRVWPDAVVEENNLNQNITALRKSLGDSRQDSQYIATIPGLGYRFIADVRKVPVASAERTLSAEGNGNSTAQKTAPILVSTVASVPPVQAAGFRSRTVVPEPKRKNRIILLSALILGPLLLAFGLYKLLTREKPVPQPLFRSIVVLPLENLSGDPSQEYFADGMTDALIGELATIGELRVISRTSSMHYKRTKKSMAEIARELNVDAAVEGTVQRSGDVVHIRAQLIHAPTDRHLWVKTFKQDMKDVLDLQKEIAEAITREVRIKTTSTGSMTAESRPAVHPKAFDDYLKGRYLYWNKRTEENLLKAIEYFQNAIRQDSNYALAYVGLADCYNSLGSVQFATFPPLEARSKAEEAAVRALEIDGSLAEAHSALGYVNHYNWNWAAAEQEFKRAIELNPNYANAHNFYASYLMSLGRVEESLAMSNRARELDPLSLSISAQRGFLLENARRYQEAIEQLQQIIAVDPENYQAHWLLGNIYAFNGQLNEAIASAEKAVELSDRAPGALGILGMVYGFAGRKAEASRILNELLSLTKTRYVTPAALAYVNIGLGDKDQAFFWLEKAYEERSNFIAYIMVVPIADPLRSDPRFESLLKRTRLK